MAETEFGKLVDQLIGTTNKYIVLETDDGVRREGKLSGWRMRDMKVNDIQVTLPVAMELNNDPMDTVELTRIKKLTVK